MNKLKEDFFLLEKLYQNSHVPLYVYEGKNKIACIPEAGDGENVFQCDGELLQRIFNAVDSKCTPVIFMEEVYILFGAFKDKQKRYYIWGPFTLIEQDTIKIASYRHKHHIQDKNYSIKKKAIRTVANIMSIAYYFYCGEKVDEEDIYFEWYGAEEKYSANTIEIEEYQLEKSEENWIHDSFDYENKFTKAVEEGNVVEMKRLMQVNVDKGSVGVVANDAFKQLEYLCVVSVTLVSRGQSKVG